MSKEEIEAVEGLNFNRLMKKMVHFTIFQILTNENGCLKKLDMEIVDDKDIFIADDLLTYEAAIFSPNFS